MKKYLFLLLAAFAQSCGDYATEGLYSLDSFGVDVGARFNDFEENPFVVVADNPISTFSIDADGGSYGVVRRLLNGGHQVPTAAVRTEEFINYFPLDYPEMESNAPISLNGEVSTCPWEASHK